MRILVTGGAGYLGSILTGHIIANGHHVTVVDDFSHRQPSLAAWCANDALEIIRGDVRDMRIVKPLVQHADAVIPLAALVGAPLCAMREDDAVAINYEAVRALLDLTSPQQAVVIATTNSGYGIGERDQECTEDSPLRPLSVYGRTKVETEKAVLDHGGVSLRLATLFGVSPRMRTDLLVNDFVQRAVRDRAVVLFEAHFRRNFLHVRDAADAFLHVLGNYDAMRGKPYNVGLSSANLTKSQLCEAINKIVPFTFIEAPVGEDPDKRDYVVSNARMEATGWRAARTLSDGIHELVKGYQMMRMTEYGNV